MWDDLLGRARGLQERVREAPARIATIARLSRESGLMWSLTAPGVVELTRVLASGSQNPAQLYRVHARNSPMKAALTWRGQTLTWAELDARIDGLADGLASRGIGPRDSLIVMLHNRPDTVEIGSALARQGAAAVSVSWRSTAKELAYLANHSGARGIVLEPERLGVLDEAHADLPASFLENVFTVTPWTESASVPRLPGVRVTPLDALAVEKPPTRPATARTRLRTDEDAAFVVYTSGTTGVPKGAVRKFPKDTMLAAMRFINETPMRVDDVHLVAAPLYHSTAFGFLSLSYLLGATAVIMDEFKPEAFLELVERHRVTTTAVVPTMLHRIMELPLDVRRRYDTRSLRAVFSGGAPLPGKLAVDFMDAFGDVLFNFYGATETGLVTLAQPQDLRAKPGTIGTPIPGNEIRLLDDDKRDVESGEVGELYVRSKLLVAGYHRDAEATASSMVDGYFSVGDLARRDRNGRFFLEGRKRDMIISGGVNVYPAEVEGVLESHPELSEVAVVGVPDDDLGERVRAFVVRRSGTSVDEVALRGFTRERLAGAKVPREFVFVDALPRNPTGKVLKRELRERGVDGVVR